MYFELLNSPAEARGLYQKELDRDPNNPLMLKRMVRLACCMAPRGLLGFIVGTKLSAG